MSEAHEWEASCSLTKSDEKHISCEVFTVTAFTESEEDARKLISDEYPDVSIDKIVRVDPLPPPPEQETGND